MATFDIDPEAEAATTAKLRREAMTPAGSLNQVAALRELSMRNPTTANASVFSELANDRAGETSVRFEATLALARMPIDQVQPELLRLITDSEPTIAVAGLRALGAAGTIDALNAVTRIEGQPAQPSLVRREAVAAANLVSHRARSTRHTFRFPGPRQFLEPTSGAQEIVERASSNAVVTEAFATLGRQALAIQPNSKGLGTAIRCVGRELLVVPSEQLEGGVAELGDKPAIAAIMLAGSNLSLERHFLSSYILTKPAERGRIELAVQNQRGRVWLAGEGTIDGDKVEYELRGVRTKNASGVKVRGTFANDERGLGFSEALSSARIDRETRPALKPVLATG